MLEFGNQSILATVAVIEVLSQNSLHNYVVPMNDTLLELMGLFELRDKLGPLGHKDIDIAQYLQDKVPIGEVLLRGPLLFLETLAAGWRQDTAACVARLLLG